MAPHCWRKEGHCPAGGRIPPASRHGLRFKHDAPPIRSIEGAIVGRAGRSPAGVAQKQAVYEDAPQPVGGARTECGRGKPDPACTTRPTNRNSRSSGWFPPRSANNSIQRIPTSLMWRNATQVPAPGSRAHGARTNAASAPPPWARPGAGGRVRRTSRVCRAGVAPAAAASRTFLRTRRVT